MSSKGQEWTREVATRTDLHPRAKVVALVLGSRHNGKTGQCTPGLKRRIAPEAGLTKRTAERAIQDLRAAGLIHITVRQKGDGAGRTSNSYALLPINGVAPKVWDRHWKDDWVGADQSAARGGLGTHDQSATDGEMNADDGGGPIRHERQTNPPPVTDQSATGATEHKREAERELERKEEAVFEQRARRESELSNPPTPTSENKNNDPWAVEPEKTWNPDTGCWEPNPHYVAAEIAA